MALHHRFPGSAKALQQPLKAPFPWFGGKSKAAAEVWKRLDGSRSYFEPFAGSLAVLLSAPLPVEHEVINDADVHVCNFWLAMKADPVELARLLDWPVLEPDLWARRVALTEGRKGLAEALAADPRYYDVEAAAWWLWAMCLSIAPQLATARSKPKNAAGGAASRQMTLSEIVRWFDWLSLRLRRVRGLCGDWQRAVTESELAALPAPRAVFLDPPYATGEGYAAGDHATSAMVRRWAVDHGERADLRIVLCGGRGEHPMPDGWQCVRWHRIGGFASRRPVPERPDQGEELWFSPACKASA